MCECSNKKPAIINFFPKGRRGVNVNYRTSMPVEPEGWNELYGDNLESSQNECQKKMNDTCSIIKLLKEKDKKIIGILGVQ